MMSQPSSAPSNDVRSTRKWMMISASLAAAVILVLIYSVSRIQEFTKGPGLKPLEITLSSRKKAPRFEWSSLEKNQTDSFSSADLQGSWTLISFWAYWCTPCMVELPTLAQLEEDWSGPELNIVTVNEDENENLEAAKKFLADEEISTKVIFDRQKKLAEAFGVTAFPTHFLINPAGEIVWSHTGGIEWSSMESKTQLLKVLENTESDAGTAD